MIILQRAHFEWLMLQRVDSLDRGLRSRHRREIWQPKFQRGASNRERIFCATSVRRVDDHRDPARLHRIYYMRAAFEHLVDSLAFAPEVSNVSSGAARREQIDSHR